jgi:transposase
MEVSNAIVKFYLHSLKAAQASSYLVADTVMYVKESIVHIDSINQLFITRVLQTLIEAKSLIAQAHYLDFSDLNAGYRDVLREKKYGDVA